MMRNRPTSETESEVKDSCFRKGGLYTHSREYVTIGKGGAMRLGKVGRVPMGNNKVVVD